MNETNPCAPTPAQYDRINEIINRADNLGIKTHGKIAECSHCPREWCNKTVFMPWVDEIMNPEANETLDAANLDVSLAIIEQHLTRYERLPENNWRLLPKSLHPYVMVGPKARLEYAGHLKGTEVNSNAKNDGLFPFEKPIWFIKLGHVAKSTCLYGQSDTVMMSNFRALQAAFPNAFSTLHYWNTDVLIYPIYETFERDRFESLQGDALDAVIDLTEGYPIYDENDHSDLEQELFEEALDDYLGDDAASILESNSLPHDREFMADCIHYMENELNWWREFDGEGISYGDDFEEKLIEAAHVAVQERIKVPSTKHDMIISKFLDNVCRTCQLGVPTDEDNLGLYEPVREYLDEHEPPEDANVEEIALGMADIFNNRYNEQTETEFYSEFRRTLNIGDNGEDPIEIDFMEPYNQTMQLWVGDILSVEHKSNRINEIVFMRDAIMCHAIALNGKFQPHYTIKFVITYHNNLSEYSKKANRFKLNRETEKWERM